MGQLRTTITHHGEMGVGDSGCHGWNSWLFCVLICLAQWYVGFNCNSLTLELSHMLVQLAPQCVQSSIPADAHRWLWACQAKQLVICPTFPYHTKIGAWYFGLAHFVGYYISCTQFVSSCIQHSYSSLWVTHALSHEFTGKKCWHSPSTFCSFASWIATIPIRWF